jgi:tetratricopeptide (TPR) repeat protein
MTGMPLRIAIRATLLRKALLLLVLIGPAATHLQAADQTALLVSSPHFTVITDAGEKQARHLLDNFERMRWVFATLFPKSNVDPATPIVVIAMKNKKGFDTLEPEAYLGKDKLNLAGLFLKTPDKNYILLRLDGEFEHPFASVYHEYTHLQFASVAETTPLWLFEGIAEFFQNTEIHEKDVQVGEADSNEIIFLRQNSLIPLETLFRVDVDSPYYHEENKGSIFYAESWALTHFLFITDRNQHTNRLGDYMNLVSQHVDPVAAAFQAFGDLKKLQTALAFYIQQSSYIHFVMNSAAAPIDEGSYKVTTLTRNQFDDSKADFLASVGRTKDARALLEAVMLADPKDALARETMGFLEYRENNHPAARKWYEEAIKLDSESYLAHYYFAMLSLGDYGPDGADIESNLRAAIRLKPDFAPAYDQLANYFGMRRQNLDEAQSLNLKAIQMDRSNLGYRFNGSNLLAERGKWSDAEKVLQSALKLARSPAEIAMVQHRLGDLARERQNAASMQSAQVTTNSTVDLSANANTPVVTTVAEPEAPRHPTEGATGPKHTALGVIRSVKCSDDTVMDFQVEIAAKPAGKSSPKEAAKTISLYTNNYYKLDLSALGFEPKNEMNVCHDIEGMKAQVQYADSSDKTVNGQAISIELRK